MVIHSACLLWEINFCRSLLTFDMDLDIGDKVFYTRSWEVVRRILTFGKGHHLPKDTASIQGGTIAPVAFYNKVSRLRTQRQETLEKQSKKRSSSTPLPPAHTN